jgi:RimJ/RimL family protein N-acetyltransferase
VIGEQRSTLAGLVALSSLLPITTARLVLRTFTPADAGSLAAYRSDPDVARYQSWEAPYSTDAARRLIDEQAHLAGPTAGEWLQIAVTLDAGVIGDVAVRLADDGRTARIGYSLATASQHRGYATEAVGAVVAGLFAEGLHRVHASLDARNAPSARLLERLGFRHEGTSISAELDSDGWCDVAHYALLDEEHRARVAPAP